MSGMIYDALIWGSIAGGVAFLVNVIGEFVWFRIDRRKDKDAEAQD